jgi:endonuclease-3
MQVSTSPREDPSARIPWRTILGAMARAVGQPLDRSHAGQTPQAVFALLVTTMISPRTKDEVTDAAAMRLLAVAPTPDALARTPERRIAELIYPAGFYRTKAASLRATARRLAQDHASRVPATLEELVALPGVGRKIASLVLSVGHGVDAICVDTHVHRIANRMGWVATRDPYGTEMALRALLPRRYWAPINHLLVSFGKRICTPTSPRCSICPVAARCARVDVGRSR